MLRWAFEHDGHLDRRTPVAAGLEEAPSIAQRFDIDRHTRELDFHPLDETSSDAKALRTRAYEELAQHRGEGAVAEGRRISDQQPIGRSSRDDEWVGVVRAQKRCYLSVTSAYGTQQLRELFTGDDPVCGN